MHTKYSKVKTLTQYSMTLSMSDQYFKKALAVTVRSPLFFISLRAIAKSLASRRTTCYLHNIDIYNSQYFLLLKLQYDQIEVE